MKKIYLLSLLFCLSFTAIAQTVTTLTPFGTTGSFSTGSSDGTTRTDDNIISQQFPANSAGYSVFDLSGIPAGAQIMSCEIGFYVNGITGSGSASSCQIYGYPGDLSAVTSPAALFTDMFPSGSSIASPADYGILPGTQIVTSAAYPDILSFIQANYTLGKVSISWTGGGFLSYSITGESGVSPLPIGASPANHQPYLHITYCSKPTISVAATPNPVCEKTTLSLSTTVTADGSTTYAWTGPASYSSALPNPSFTTTLASDGVYSVTLTSTCSAPPAAPVTFTANAGITVTVNPAPAAITGASVVCLPEIGATVLSDAAGGTWSSTLPGVATVNSGGVVTSVGAGITNILYTLPTGCFTTFPLKVSAAPAAISGPNSVCENSPVTLTETSSGGLWTSDAPGVASVVAGTVTGVSPGSATISFTIAGCNPATYAVTVNPLPPPITGGTNVCMGLPITFSDAMPGGTWSTTSATASFGPPGPVNELSAISIGTATITYTSTHGCFTTLTVDVNDVVAPITGTSAPICEHNPAGTILSDATPGGFWSTAGTTATVDFATGQVVGVGSGNADITYNLGACKVFYTVTVTAAPFPVSGPATVCQNDSFYLSDATTGAAWSSGDITLATIDPVTGFVKTPGVTSPGGVNITYTFPGSGCYSIFNLLIKPSPDAALTYGATTFCTGGSVTINATTTTSGQTYQWYSNSVPISGATTAAYTTDSTETVTLKIDNTVLCSTTSEPVVVISGISPTLTLTGVDTFCEGKDAVLTANPHSVIGRISYQWTKNGINITGANAPVYAATTTGIYNCEVSVAGTSGNCTVHTADTALLVHPAPAPSITYASRKLHTDASYTGYQWVLNTAAVLGATNSIYAPTQNGGYKVVVTDANGCTGHSATINITTVGIKNISRSDIRTYPNPASAVVNIESPVSVNAVITSMEGKTILQQADVKNINISNFASGLYLIMIYDEHGEMLAVEKLIKE